MTPDQCREARRLLGWSTERLGALSETAAHVVSAFEREGRVTAARAGSKMDRLAALRVTLEQAGVTFLDKGSGPGVKLRNSTDDDPNH